MYKLYFSDRVVIIDSNATNYSPDEVCYVTPDDPELQKAKFLQKVQNTKRLVLITDDENALYQVISDQFVSIEAGGGLVTNKQGDILMIFRHSRWDLPKGKLESGECIDECAVREVEEETGISDVEQGRKLVVTNHFYRLNGDWVMKKTSWYEMSYSGDAVPVPQVEEGITAIEWANPAKLDQYLKTTYSTIVDVFEAGGYKVR